MTFGCAEIGHDAALLQSAADGGSGRVLDGDMTAAAVVFPRRADGVAVGRFEQTGFFDQIHQVGRQSQRLVSQRIDPGFCEDAERPEQRCAVEEGGGADLPGTGAGRAFPLVRHIELAFLAISPPAGESGTHAEVLAIDIERADAARTGVQILIGTPEGEIDLPIVEAMGNRADGMRAIEPGDDAALTGGERRCARYRAAGRNGRAPRAAVPARPRRSWRRRCRPRRSCGRHARERGSGRARDRRP